MALEMLVPAKFAITHGTVKCSLLPRHDRGSRVMDACLDDAALQRASLGAARGDGRPAAVEVVNVTLEGAGVSGTSIFNPEFRSSRKLK